MQPLWWLRGSCAGSRAAGLSALKLQQLTRSAASFGGVPAQQVSQRAGRGLSSAAEEQGGAADEAGVVRESVEVGGSLLHFEVGRLAKLAGGSCVVRYNDTVVLSTAVVDPTPKPEEDSTPLQVDYRERLSAVGRIPSRGDRRDPKASDRETLCARAIDRALRPLFPPGFLYDTHVTATVLAADGSVDPEVLAINGASAALMVSGIPWHGPVGAVRLAHMHGPLRPHSLLTVNPPAARAAASSLSLTYAGVGDRVVMLEAAASQVPEEQVARALRFAAKQAAKLAAPQRALAAAVGRPRRRLPLLGPSAQLQAAVDEVAAPLLQELFGEGAVEGKADRGALMADVQRRVLRLLRERGLLEGGGSQPGPSQQQQQQQQSQFIEQQQQQQQQQWQHTEASALQALDIALGKAARTAAVVHGRRLDGRHTDELRPISAEAGTLPRVVHGSALFARGDTQSLCSAAVGPDRDGPSNDEALLKPPRHLYLHYSFPPFSTNEVGKFGGPNRREVGHGALAERALVPLMPAAEDFPFVARVVAETLGSSGSSSMAAVCAGAMALAHAGVPLKALAAGISIGLMTERFPAAVATDGNAPLPQRLEEYGDSVLLTDIQGSEDHLGDMDLKVAGTRQGVTAIQLDTKLPGLDMELLVSALQPAAAARHKLLDAMEAALAKAEAATDDRERPQHGSIEINKELLPRLIGVQGSNLTEIETQTGGRILVTDTGEVSVYAPTRQQYEHAVAAVREVEGLSIRVGENYTIKVVKVVDYGAFVELPNGMPALLHISELSHSRVRDVHDLLREGQVMEVQCVGRDSKGIIQLSRKALLPKPPPRPPQGPRRAPEQQQQGGEEEDSGTGAEGDEMPNAREQAGSSGQQQQQQQQQQQEQHQQEQHRHRRQQQQRR